MFVTDITNLNVAVSPFLYLIPCVNEGLSGRRINVGSVRFGYMNNPEF